MSSETDLLRKQAIQNQRNSFSRGFPLLFNVETLQAFSGHFSRFRIIIGNFCIVNQKCYVFKLINFLLSSDFYLLVLMKQYHFIEK
jgi:hypothetical protein